MCQPGPLPKGPMAELAGQPLTKGLHRGAIFSIQGDQEFISNVLKMPHWMNKHPCAECDCQRPVYKKELAPPGKSTKILKSEEQTYHFKTVEESVLDKKTDHPLFSLDGITPLHVLFSRGVANHLSGSLIHYVIYFDWPRRQKISANNTLQTLFARIKELYSEASVSAIPRIDFWVHAFCQSSKTPADPLIQSRPCAWDGTCFWNCCEQKV